MNIDACFLRVVRRDSTIKTSLDRTEADDPDDLESLERRPGSGPRGERTEFEQAVRLLALFSLWRG